MSAAEAPQVHLIRISGLDQVGVLAGVTGLLARENAIILDVGESVIHASLSMGLLVQLSPKTEVARLVESLETFLAPIGLSTEVTEVSQVSYENWVQRGGRKRQIVTLMANPLTAEQLQAVCNVGARHGYNIDRMRRLSGRAPLRDSLKDLHCIEIAVQEDAHTPHEEAKLRAEWLQVGRELGCDISVQADNVFRRHRRLVAFDMDSTLIEMEVIDEMAGRMGMSSEVEGITEAAMQGDMDFTESLRARTGMLKGLPTMVLEEIAGEMPLTRGANRLIGILRSLGYKVAIISGGFDYFARHLGRRVGADYVFANELETLDGVLTGRLLGPIVDRTRKAQLLREISQQEGISLDQVIAVGDGANDTEMLAAAGLGVAFHAKPLVAAQSSHAISRGGLDTILYLLGISTQELRMESLQGIGDERR